MPLHRTLRISLCTFIANYLSELIYGRHFQVPIRVDLWQTLPTTYQSLFMVDNTKYLMRWFMANITKDQSEVNIKQQDHTLQRLSSLFQISNHLKLNYSCGKCNLNKVTWCIFTLWQDKTRLGFDWLIDWLIDLIY